MVYKRIFIIVCDSLGIGYLPDAKEYGDEGANTFVHIAERMGGLNIPTMNQMGVGELDNIVGTTIVEHPHSYVTTLKETNHAKDTLTGHWEMMGVKNEYPFMSFTDTGFPKELIDELEEKTGHKVIGNYAASGTEILKELGEEQKRDNSLIVYTSSDSVLQIAAHEETTGVEELYRCCDIAREMCMKPEWRVGRIIARPFVGEDKNSFKRTPNRHDLAVSASVPTVMDILKENGYEVSCIGKIGDIFAGRGYTKTRKTVSNEDGMDKVILEASENDFTGLCFVNLVEFDSEYGHRRDVEGYARCIEAFDKRFADFLKVVREDDLVLVTADHGNDPTWTGTDHTRERVPLIMYSKSIKNGRALKERDSFADIGATILKNFSIEKPDNLLGTPIDELLSKNR